VAVYEDGELVDPRSLSYYRAGNWPTLAQLNADHAASRQVLCLPVARSFWHYSRPAPSSP
jgi:hypothetical protein